ncbi:D-alanine--(R)-lactate ligase [Streptomyces millisiae]|uniref:D-alanine--D-alanine ligase n=1 Tax=Streptomyces millisiae TaxID=3075542 RepID=A0ABU2LN89_9ACTN|nr:D-alanine--(R)-lactate ligase [Streptomyces sp. DSM 44918]MDT0319051.1 D-alanine--(R)-lactate ligase [Streptomyces sp. DSM 44918]
MARLKIGIIFGGCSEEHHVSVKSAREVARNLDLEKYEPFYVGITESGAWKLCEGPGPNWEKSGRRTVVLSPDRSVHGLLVLEQGRYGTIRLDVVLPVLHGRLGEDGAMQGLLELAGVPYVGCDVQSSALCMDKSLAYTVARSAGIATPNFRTVTADVKAEDVDLDGLSYPVFVKPARSGSSFGVSKASRKEELPGAVATARQYDAKVLIEEAVVGAEVGCAVLGDDPDLIVGEVDHIALSHGFFRIHQEDEPESGSENSTAIVPADIPAESRTLVRNTAKAVYRALGCGGLARVDMFLKGDGTVVLNEVNTFPGMTSYSRYPRMMAAAGLPISEVIDRAVSSALAGKSR